MWPIPLRYLGFAPDDLSTAPWEAVVYVAKQLSVSPEAIKTYGNRIKTRTTHLQRVQEHLGFRKALPLDFYALQTWLVDRALEHDKPTLLLQLACEKLRREQIVRPGITRLERLVASARQKAHDETFRRLTPLLSEERTTFLGGLLIPDPHSGYTRLSWLREDASSHSAPQLVEALKRVRFLLDCGVAAWDLSALNPNRVKWLAQLGWKTPTYQLQRMASLWRYPILIAFLQQALLYHTDVAVDFYDQCLWEYHGAAKKDLIEFRQKMARSTNEKLRFLRELAEVLLDPDIEDEAVRAANFERVPEETLRKALADTQELIRPRHDDAIDFFGKRYSTVRQFAPAFLETLTFRAQGPHNPVLPCVSVIRDLNRASTRRPVPKDAPLSLVTDAWRPYMALRHHLGRV